ncbi:helix-turn-helix domain-containing protein [Nocardia sp. NPDC052278]|uniref:helix-turn-helix domain-containing protein n=1 Tax=unclassified Nocardia TaxID=2637762 RepID=UPI0036AEDB48
MPERERFAIWQEVVSQTFMPHYVRVDHDSDFRAELGAIALDDLNIVRMAQPSLQVWRTAKQIRQCDPEIYTLWFDFQGTAEMTQGRQSRVAGPGELMLTDSSHPLHVAVDAGTGTHRGITFVFPRSVLPLPEQQVRKLMVRPLSMRSGVGSILTAYMRELFDNAGALRPADIPRLSSISMDLVSATFAHHLDIDTALPSETRQLALLASMRTFIRHNLADPELGPEQIARAHAVSTRHLHRIFRAQGTSVSELIRAQRLENCRRDLTDPQLIHRPVYAIGARWGFGNAPHFNRTFRQAYGTSPEAYRRQHLVVPTSDTAPEH